jgi:hypothetical protein
MTVELNHTIVPARDPQASAQFLAGVEPHHYAFMLGEPEFDAALARIRDRGITHYGDPACRDPDGHLMEILTPGGAAASSNTTGEPPCR